MCRFIGKNVVQVTVEHVGWVTKPVGIILILRSKEMPK